MFKNNFKKLVPDRMKRFMTSIFYGWYGNYASWNDAKIKSSGYDQSLGTFYPVVTRKDSIIDQWEKRDITSIPECKDCAVQLACGGGCGSVAKNRTGIICSSDCRPVKELLELGFSAYFENIKA